MDKGLKPLYGVVTYLLACHLLGLLAMTLCRVVLLVANMPEAGIDWSLLPKAMLIGVKFDNLIACYISALPFIVIPVLSLCWLGKEVYGKRMHTLTRAVEWYYGVLMSLVIFVGVADARYYHFFENHLNISVTEWFGFVGDTAGLVFGDSMNLVFLGVAAALMAAYVYGLKKIGEYYKNRLLS